MSDNIVLPLPTWVLGTWILVTLFAPFAVFYYAIAGNQALIGGDIVYALLWAYLPINANYDFGGASIFGIISPYDLSNPLNGFHILNPAILSTMPVFGFSTILLGVLLIRYVQDKTSLRKMVIAGLLNFAIPLYQVFLFGPQMIHLESLSFIGPIPIQLIVGLLIAKKYGPKPPDKPWE